MLLYHILNAVYLLFFYNGDNESMINIFTKIMPILSIFLIAATIMCFILTAKLDSKKEA
jgi:hypothetical protein